MSDYPFKNRLGTIVVSYPIPYPISRTWIRFRWQISLTVAYKNGSKVDSIKNYPNQFHSFLRPKTQKELSFELTKPLIS